MDPQEKQMPNQLTITLHPPSKQFHKYLQIVATVLKVDKQLKPEMLQKKIEYEEEKGSIIVKVAISLLKFMARELKLLRACVTGFFRHMQLVVKTLNQFKEWQ